MVVVQCKHGGGTMEAWWWYNVSMVVTELVCLASVVKCDVSMSAVFASSACGCMLLLYVSSRYSRFQVACP